MAEREGIDGMKWMIGAEGVPESHPFDEGELETLREEALVLMRSSPDRVALRSCWQCNDAHVHFLSGEWGEWICRCFGCGRIYFKGADLTDWS